MGAEVEELLERQKVLVSLLAPLPKADEHKVLLQVTLLFGARVRAFLIATAAWTASACALCTSSGRNDRLRLRSASTAAPMVCSSAISGSAISDLAEVSSMTTGCPRSSTLNRKEVSERSPCCRRQRSSRSEAAAPYHPSR